jgi:hypothetical protein
MMGVRTWSPSRVRAGPTRQGIQRPTLERVSYRFAKGTLRRMHWAVLDSTEGSQPVRRDLLTHVKSVTFRFMNDSRQWVTQWPAVGASPAQSPVRRAGHPGTGRLGPDRAHCRGADVSPRTRATRHSAGLITAILLVALATILAAPSATKTR